MYHHDICPYCHGQNFILAQQQSDGTLAYHEIVTLDPGRLYHIICLNCGTVVRTFMEDPSVLLTLDPPAEPEAVEVVAIDDTRTEKEAFGELQDPR